MGRSQRQQKKRHIRAAREWLGKAENSLEQQDDLQGELKLMLAKAELSQLEESAKAQRWRRRILRLLALVTAIVIAAIGIYFVPGLWPQAKPVTNHMEETPAQTTQTETDSQVLPQEQQNEVSSISQTTETSDATKESSSETAPVTTQNEAPEEESETSTVNETDRSAPVAENPSSVPTSQSSTASAPPDLEKQQLMQSAGKVLRQ